MVLDDIQKRKEALQAQQKSSEIASEARKAKKEEQLRIQKKANWMFTKLSIVLFVVLVFVLITVLFLVPRIPK